MQYIEFQIILENKEDFLYDILSDQLSSIGFESFVQQNDSLYAYVPKDSFDEQLFDDLINRFSYSSVDSCKKSIIQSRNWNEEWEKHYFKPIVIGDECVIHSSFHANVPSAKYDIVIDPKMAFGTGHHETTGLVVEQILKSEMENLKVLDMGCGTAILAILAMMKGAKSTVAVDIDTWCVENSLENIALNKVEGVEVLLGGAEQIKGRKFDLILANINRNILLRDMREYAQCLDAGGMLYMSGFYVEDIPLIQEEALKQRLDFQYFKEKNNWVVVKTVKAG